MFRKDLQHRNSVIERQWFMPAVDDDSAGVSGGWYRAPGWGGAAPKETLTDRS
jgi:hypothetical protein